MAGSGFAAYDDAHNPKYGDPHPVPILEATDEALKGYGTRVYDYDREQVEIIQWPQTGSRPICPGTGIQAGIADGDFDYWWEGDIFKAINKTVDVGGMSGKTGVIGRLPKDVSQSNKTAILAREANYHPDGSQVFYPCDNTPFVLLLAPPGDDIKLEDFVAFYCDGSFGVHMKPKVWHQPAYPTRIEATLRSKQSKVYACVRMDTVDEFGKFLRVPLEL